MSAIQAIDVALRGGVVMLLLLVAALLVRDYAQAIAARLGRPLRWASPHMR